MKAMMLLAAGLCAASVTLAAEFESPVRLKGGEKYMRVEFPGYAAPCVVDLDRDGKHDVLVGQFRDGKIHVFKGQGGLKFAKAEWLEIDGKPAEVPGVW